MRAVVIVAENSCCVKQCNKWEVEFLEITFIFNLVIRYDNFDYLS